MSITYVIENKCGNAIQLCSSVIIALDLKVYLIKYNWIKKNKAVEWQIQIRVSDPVKRKLYRILGFESNPTLVAWTFDVKQEMWIIFVCVYVCVCVQGTVD